jgi:hypothetical protein
VKGWLDAADAKHADRTRAKRILFQQLVDDLQIRYAKLNGAQVVEIRRRSVALAGADQSLTVVR